MKRHLLLLVMLFALAAWSCKTEPPVAPTPEPEPPTRVEKTNPMRVYMHYMPWFNTQEFSGFWGYHWTLGSRNPNIVDANGRREIAAHYYPLIGPYDSSDPDLIDYHLMLMKYIGVDGLLIDWYGTHDVNDYKINFDNSNALINRSISTGLGFGVVYEEFTAENVANALGMSAITAAQTDVQFMQANYFRQKNYLRVNDDPLWLTFGPRYFNDDAEWDQILTVLRNPTNLLPLWNASHRVGSQNVAGEFGWVDFTNDLSEITGFYQSAPNEEILIGSAYPGFHDYYAEAGVGSSFGYVDHANGQTLQRLLDKATEFDLEHLQLVTWNDFGEGTMLEPTVEFEYQFLEIIQDFTGVTYGRAELEMITEYYLQRKALAGNSAAQATLDQVYEALNDLEPAEARTLLDSL